MIWIVGRCGYMCSSRGGCGCLGASLVIYGQEWAKVDRSGWVRLIGQGWVTWLVGGCGYTCRSRGGRGQVWADKGKG